MFVGILGGGACLVIHLLRDDDLPGVSLDLRPPVRLRARAWWLRFLYLAEFPCRYLPLRALAVARACAAVCVVGVGTEYARKGPRPGVAPGQDQS
jgi:hypothetical protein